MNTLCVSIRASVLFVSVSALVYADSLTVEGDLNTTGNVTIGTVSQAKNLNVTGDVTIAGSLEVDGQAVVTVDALETYVTATQLSGYVTVTQLSSAGYLTSSGNGSNLTNLNAGSLSSGTISVDRLPSVVSQLGATIELDGEETTGNLSWSRVNKDDSSLADLASRDYADLQGTPTTLSGYGIIDAVAKDEDGNVGIGTDTPTAKLDVIGDVKITGALTVGGVNVLTNSGTLPVGMLPTAVVQTSATQTLTNKTLVDAVLSGATLTGSTTLGGAEPVDQVIITSSGNVGIGTNPSSKLTVSATSGQDGITVETAGALQPVIVFRDTVSNRAGGLRLAGGGSELLQIGGSPAGTLSVEAIQISTDVFGAGANALIDVNSSRISLINGNVGVGTTTPEAKLDVVGGVQISGDVKMKNNAVIRISPAGDLSMGEFDSGIDPATN